MAGRPVKSTSLVDGFVEWLSRQQVESHGWRNYSRSHHYSSNLRKSSNWMLKQYSTSRLIRLQVGLSFDLCQPEKTHIWDCTNVDQFNPAAVFYTPNVNNSAQTILRLSTILAANPNLHLEAQVYLHKSGNLSCEQISVVLESHEYRSIVIIIWTFKSQRKDESEQSWRTPLFKINSSEGLPWEQILLWKSSKYN